VRVEVGGVLLEERVGHIVVGHRGGGGGARGKLAISILSRMCAEFLLRDPIIFGSQVWIAIFGSRIANRKFYRAHQKDLRPP
jgi:hypothetical protein